MLKLLNSRTILVVRFGAMTPVSSVQQDTISIAKVSAAKCKQLANSSILNKASAKNAMRDTKWSMATAKLLTQRSHKKLDVQAGKVEYALNVQKDGTLTLKKSVSKLMISAQLGMRQMELVNLATLAISFQMELVL